MPVPQAITASVGEKRKKLEGKIFDEPPMIPYTAVELSHVLDKWIRDGIVRPFTVSRPLTEEERKNLLFYRIHNYVRHSTKDYWTLHRFFYKKLGREPWSSLKRSPNCRGTLYLTTKKKGWWL